MALLQISEPGQAPDPHARRIAIGIDLGTTHSLVASVRNGVSEFLPDDDGRVMVMIAFNNDIADGWQRADDPGYPQYEANLSIRLGVNFAVYALTH